MDNGWVYGFVMQQSKQMLGSIPSKPDVFFAPGADKLWDSLFQDLGALHRLKSQPDKTTKEKSTEISEYKGTLLAVCAPEP